MTSLLRKNITGKKTSCTDGCSCIFIYLCPPPLHLDNVWSCLSAFLVIFAVRMIQKQPTMNVNMADLLHLSLNQENVVHFSTQCFQSLLNFPSDSSINSWKLKQQTYYDSQSN